MLSQKPAAGGKKVWFLVFFALTFSVGLYGLIALLVWQNQPIRIVSPNLPPLKIPVICAGIVAVSSAVAWLHLKVDGKIGGEGREVTLSAGEFETCSLVALMLSEACAIFGLLLFFLGASIEEFAIFAAGTLFVDFAFILPRGLQFWSTQK